MELVSAAATRARALIAGSQNMVLATATLDGAPWVTPLFFVPDADHGLLWTSEPTARHSQNIRGNPRVAIAIYDDTRGRRVEAAYLEGSARELSTADELDSAITAMAHKPQPERWRARNRADVSADGPWRIYRAEITSVDVRMQASLDGRPVARRQPVELGLAWPLRPAGSV